MPTYSPLAATDFLFDGEEFAAIVSTPWEVGLLMIYCIFVKQQKLGRWRPPSRETSHVELLHLRSISTEKLSQYRLTLHEDVLMLRWYR